MKKTNLLIGLTLLLGIAVIISKVCGMERTSEISRAFFFPMFAVIYFLERKFRDLFFSAFVVLFALGELFYLVDSENWSSIYFVASASLISAYFCMLIFMLKKLNLKKLIVTFPLHIIVLMCVGLYVFIELDKTLGFTIENTEGLIEYILESSYNIMIISVFSISFLYYLYFDTKPSLTFFLAFVFIALSEILQIGYYFISSDTKLNVLYSLFLVIGFYFLYKFIEGDEKENIKLI